MEYEWDPAKASSNLEKHGVDFADAVIALEDENALSMADDHPDEERFVAMGIDALGRVLVVVYTWRDERVRVISARTATPRERRLYEDGR